jgi:hypothetical protein
MGAMLTTHAQGNMTEDHVEQQSLKPKVKGKAVKRRRAEASVPVAAQEPDVEALDEDDSIWF